MERRDDDRRQPVPTQNLSRLVLGLDEDRLVVRSVHADEGPELGRDIDHVSVVAGMPQGASSWILGPLYLVLTMLAAVVAPILLLASLFRLIRR